MFRGKISTTALIAALAAFALLGCGKQINFLKARNELNKGVKAFSAANYTTAAEHFDTAIEMDPELLAARSYRAYSYMMQYIPGGTSRENLEIAQTAIDGFNDVLERDPNNTLALSSLASLYFNMKELDEAKEWNKKLIEVDPENKEAYYTIGVINWTKAYEPRSKLRAELGMKMEDPGPIKDAEKREELAEQTVPLIEEGIEMLTKAIEIDPDYEDAMAYTNLLYRERADLAESEEEYEKYQSIADEWVQKTLDTKKRKAEQSTKELFTAEE